MNKKEAIERLKYIDRQYDYNNYYSRYDLDCIETVLNLLEKKQNRIQELEKALIDDDYKHRAEIEKKDKMIDDIQKEVREHIGFENRLKRNNREPDLFNQGRFYVANNINNILKGKQNNE